MRSRPLAAQRTTGCSNFSLGKAGSTRYGGGGSGLPATRDDVQSGRTEGPSGAAACAPLRPGRGDWPDVGTAGTRTSNNPTPPDINQACFIASLSTEIWPFLELRREIWAGA